MDNTNENPEMTNPEAGQDIEFSQRTDLSGIAKAVNEVKSEVRKVIVGQEEMVDQIIIAILCDGHVLIEGVPGIAKTLAAKLTARTLDVDFRRIQFTPDLMPSDILGTSVFNPKNSEFEFMKGPVFTNVLLVDEINRSPAKTQSALFEVMEERQVTIDGKEHKMEAPFLVIATQNPIEMEGTYRLPEAQIDRFLFKINVSYPTGEEEVEILKMKNSNRDHLDLSKIKSVIDSAALLEYRNNVHDIHVTDGLMGYISEIVRKTRGHHDLFLGASPRASISILFAAKANAAVKGRDYIIPEDIHFVAVPVLRHRIILTSEQEMEGRSPDDIVRDIIHSIEIPR